MLHKQTGKSNNHKWITNYRSKMGTLSLPIQLRARNVPEDSFLLWAGFSDWLRSPPSPANRPRTHFIPSADTPSLTHTFNKQQASGWGCKSSFLTEH